ncbi:hypothetical protein K432DRAFT_439914 [Lepidopterella palustris CBS 459.81]|uniref:Carboxylase:pyruvate/acetyl-coa/propionyl-CoA n=1 Tax=Lepidopterella palustris CBS 459.81 TaxID=1314670 RepID=A0A8E2JJB2_9PEZI|nr:hypothetical protein K432DRAFT_439914 [Lepidopterella palustris CBS 459.81]
MSRPHPRPIKRLLVANRGEIAVRILSTARELGIETYAVYTPGDTAHAVKATYATQLPSAASYLNIQELINIAKKHHIDSVHPGYGFLSESGEFSRRMWEEAGAMVVGPGWGILASTGDKLRARLLAEESNVPVLPALQRSTNCVDDIRSFASQIGYPIMIKAVDGGGGRGIRLIHDEPSLAGAVNRAVEESPSRQIFAEKAAIDGFRHVEVQIIGDGHGNVRHLWERECSIQRRYQKVVEIAPSSISDRKLVAGAIRDALRMAREIKYFSLGTFEFLVNPSTKQYYFLEVNPRLQVEHTITESISMTDIVKIQLLLAQGVSLNDCGLSDIIRQPEHPPPLHSIQLRITAENVQSNWSLSIGKIQSFQFPSGNGIRIDTHLINRQSSIVSADFDSLLAKLIITASTWPDAVRKAQVALEETEINGVKTNLDILNGIISHPDFMAGNCDTQWLDKDQQALLKLGRQALSYRPSGQGVSAHEPSSAIARQANTLFRKGDAWSIALSPPNPPNNTPTPPPHHLQLTRILRNEFPSSLTAEIVFTAPSASPTKQPQSTPYTLTLASTTASSGAITSHHRRGNPSDPSHIVIPFPGKLVEVLVDEGDVLKEGDVVCVVQQMKMELEVRAPRGGRVVWVMEVEDGEEVGEGVLAAIVDKEGQVSKARL